MEISLKCPVCGTPPKPNTTSCPSCGKVYDEFVLTRMSSSTAYSFTPSSGIPGAETVKLFDL